MTKLDELMLRALDRRGDKELYQQRRNTYPALERYGQLPSYSASLRSHGLAFRMATYSCGSEHIFARLNELLALAEQADGWIKEFGNWNQNGDHWAYGWPRFYHFIWLLQCFEYFKHASCDVVFSGTNEAAPDLRVTSGSDEFYVECTVCSKWWFNEERLRDVLLMLHPQLRIERTFNVAYSNEHNPFSSEHFDRTTATLAAILSPERLAEAEMQAAIASPVVLHDLKYQNIVVSLEGGGEYVPNPNNAHGDPEASLHAFIREVISSKENRNGLLSSRPNVLMINGLGTDFQTGIAYAHNPRDAQNDVGFADFSKGAIDEVWIASCGLGEKLAGCCRLLKEIRPGHRGCGF